MLSAPSRKSLISEVAECLRAAIGSGEFENQLPGVRRLSRDLGVSVPTLLAAIRILAKERRVLVCQGRPTTILDAGRRRPAGRRAKRVIFLGFSAENIQFSPYYREVRDLLLQQGHEVELRHYLRKAWGIRKREFEQLTGANRADCWVLVSAPWSVQRMFAEKGLPCLLESGTSQGVPGLPDFELDYAALYRHMANHLINLGHRRFHLLLPERSAAKNPESTDAFIHAVRLRLPEIPSEQLVRTHDGTPAGFRVLLASLFKPAEHPTALCIGLVCFYIQAQSWLMRRGFHIPRDVSLISRDGDALLGYLEPSPAHYHVNMPQTCKRLARTITAIAGKRPVKHRNLILPEFVAGDSTATNPQITKTASKFRKNKTASK